MLTGGVAWAATKLARKSVKSQHIATGAVASTHIKDRSIRLRDLGADITGKGADGRTGATGTQGAAGLQGPAGPKGDAGPQGAQADRGGLTRLRIPA